jgi:hypothetical protein
MRLTCKYRPARLRVISESVIEDVEESLSHAEGRPIVVVAYEVEDEQAAEITNFTPSELGEGMVSGARFHIHRIWVPLHGLCLELEIDCAGDQPKQRRSISFSDTIQGREVAMAILQECDEIDKQRLKVELGLPMH